MKRILATIILAMALSLIIGSASRTGDPWKVYATNGKTCCSALGLGGDLATVSLPPDAKLAFLTSTSALVGDLTGHTLSATMTISVTGSPIFTYGGQGTFNPGTRPANVRFYFTTNPKPFNLSVSQNNEDNYWWSSPVSIDLVDLVNNTVTLTVALTPDQWGNANGHSGSEHPAGFAAAVANVRQIGLGFGGGSFFDVGVGVTGGTATFHLIDYHD